MACFVPFNNRNLDVSFFLFRPTVVLDDDLINALIHFCLYTESLGCVHSSIFKSIHGNMIIWYGAWLKRSDEKIEILSATLVSMLTNLSSMAILVDHSFFNAYAGESKDGSPAAKFSTNNIIFMSGAVPSAANELDALSYANLALFKSIFQKMEGMTAGVCLNCHSKPRVLCLNVWKSLHSCYSWLLNTDLRGKLLPFINHISIDMKYDIFKVVYVSGDNMLSFQFFPHQMLEYGGESKEEGQIMQD